MHFAPRFSHFSYVGEMAFMDGAALDENPYEDGEAADSWRAGWLAASYAAVSAGTSGEAAHLAG